MLTLQLQILRFDPGKLLQGPGRSWHTDLVAQRYGMAIGPSEKRLEIFGLLLGAMTVTQALSPAIFGAIADAVGLAGTVRLFAGPAVLSWIVLFLVARTRSVRHLVSTKPGENSEGTRSFGTA